MLHFCRIEGNMQVSRITNDDLEHLLSIDREIKFEHSSFYGLANIQITELFKFADKHVEPTGKLNIHFPEADQNFKANFIEEWTKRKEIIPTCSLNFPSHLF